MFSAFSLLLSSYQRDDTHLATHQGDCFTSSFVTCCCWCDVVSCGVNGTLLVLDERGVNGERGVALGPLLEYGLAGDEYENYIQILRW